MIDFSQIKYFKEAEFQGQADLLDPIVIYNLDILRDILNQKIYVSPAEGAIARAGGSKTSQHYIGPTLYKIVRKSTAVDVFIEGIPFINFMAIKESKLFSGLGVYLDTFGPDGMPWVMIHLDLRMGVKNIPLVWIATKKIEPEGRIYTKYSYPVNNDNHWKLLQRDIFFTDKIWLK